VAVEIRVDDFAFDRGGFLYTELNQDTITAPLKIAFTRHNKIFKTPKTWSINQ
jgi:hypothetical protein